MLFMWLMLFIPQLNVTRSTTLSGQHRNVSRDTTPGGWR
jgi:hypothetical protein